MLGRTGCPVVWEFPAGDLSFSSVPTQPLVPSFSDRYHRSTPERGEEIAMRADHLRSKQHGRVKWKETPKPVDHLLSRLEYRLVRVGLQQCVPTNTGGTLVRIWTTTTPFDIDLLVGQRMMFSQQLVRFSRVFIWPFLVEIG